MNKIMLGMVFVLLLGGVLLVAVTYSRGLQLPTNTTTQPQQTGQTTPVTPVPTVGEQPVSNINLAVSFPTNGQTVNTASVTVRGKTVASAQVAVNNVDTVADANGNFSALVTLDEGDNEIMVVANDANGNYAEQTVSVTYDSGL